MLALDTILQNRYRIVRQLGQGGMGTVYEAIDQRFDSQVAIKETHFSDEVLRKQFEREARLLNRLRHPALTRVIDHFSENEGQFLVMDFVAGEELWEMLQKQERPFPVDKVLDWADQLLDALAYLHQQNPAIIHRDIKPQNLKLSDSGRIILLDFGLAKGFAGQISRVTTSGSIFGYTPNYAPLEQIQGTGTDARSDLYSLGATLYHLLTGAPPPDVLSRLTVTTDDRPDPLLPANEVNQTIPVEVARVLSAAMAVGRNQRPKNAGEMRTRLRDAGHSSLTSQKNSATQETLIDPPPTISAPAAPLAPTVAADPAENLATPSAKRPVVPETIASPQPTLRVSSAASPALTPSVSSETIPSHRPNFLLWGGLIAVILVGVLIAFLAFNGNFSTDKKGAGLAVGSNPIKVGVFADLSGPTASFGVSSVNGIKMAADEINKAGGVDGRQIEILVEDDRGLPAQGATAVSKLIHQDKVHAIVGGEASSISIAAAPTAQAAKIPMITTAATNVKVTQAGDYVFRACFIDPFQGEVMASFAATNLQAGTAALMIDQNSDYSRALADTFVKNFIKLGGRIVLNQTYTMSDRDFSAQLKSIRAANPDVVFIPGYYQSVAIIAKQARAMGMNTTLLGGDGWDSPALFENGGDALNGSYISSHYSVDDSAPLVQRFVNNYRTRFNVPPDAVAALAYDAMGILADSIKRAGTTESEKLREAIAQTERLAGVTGSISKFNSDRNPIKPAVILEIRNGKFVTREWVLTSTF